jgi:hypothetical protein
VLSVSGLVPTIWGEGGQRPTPTIKEARGGGEPHVTDRRNRQGQSQEEHGGTYAEGEVGNYMG